MERRVRESKAQFIHEPLQSKRKFDPRSFRTVVRGAHRVTFGCPKGKYSPSTELCKVPVQIQKILHPMEEAMLSNPCPLSKNPFPTGLRRRESWKTGGRLVSKKKFNELVKSVQDSHNVSEKEARSWVRERYTTSLREKIFEGWGDPRKISSSRKRELVERFKGAYPGIYAKFKGRTRLNPKRGGSGTFLGEELRGVSFIRPKKGLLSLIHGRPLYAVKFGEGSEIVIQAGSRKEAVGIARSFSKIPIISAIKIKRNPKRRPLIERASYYKWYVGFRRPRIPRVFKSRTKPTLETHGYFFDFVTGPFKSSKEANRFKVHSEV